MKLVITTKNGRHRKEHTFPIESDVAQDPVARAQAISVASASLMDRVVNWKIAE